GSTLLDRGRGEQARKHELHRQRSLQAPRGQGWELDHRPTAVLGWSGRSAHHRGARSLTAPNSGTKEREMSMLVDERQGITDHRIGSREEFEAAREELLVREKEHTRQGDELAEQRRELPWVPLEKEYSFDTGEGMRTLTELFDGRSQLLIYHFMFGPNYKAG